MALYHSDAIMTRPSAPDNKIVGTGAILAAFQSRPARYSRHFCTNIVIDVKSETAASARSRILLFVADPGPFPESQKGGLTRLAGLPLVGEYADRFIFSDKGWRFSERRGRFSFQP
jgi:hypothetical protein